MKIVEYQQKRPVLSIIESTNMFYDDYSDDAMFDDSTIEERAAWKASDAGLESWDHNKSSEDQAYVMLTKIIVPTQRDKEQFLLALKYLHDCDVDTNFYAVNTLVHLYNNPDLIQVTGE